MPDSFYTHAKGIRILPGQWRPHYPFEQIAWISPSWPSQDYIWLDFPEVFETERNTLYLSHDKLNSNVLFQDLPRVQWIQEETGIHFDRVLPNGVRFGGKLEKRDDSSVGMEFHVANDSREALVGTKARFCLFLRASREFSDFTNCNKFIHVPKAGWVSLAETEAITEEEGRYRVGWKGGRGLADLPVVVLVSRQDQVGQATPPKLVAMSWHEHTHTIVANPSHPCMHADPIIGDLGSGERASIQGEIVFFEGDLEAFEETEIYRRIVRSAADS